MFVGLEAAELEYQSKTPDYEERPDYWESDGTFSNVLDFFLETGRAHEALQCFLGCFEEELSEDQSQIILEAMWKASPATLREWVENDMKFFERKYREDFNKWYGHEYGWEAA